VSAKATDARNGFASAVPTRLMIKMLPLLAEAATHGQLPPIVPVSFTVMDKVQSLVPDMMGVICGRTHRDRKDGR
jgi:hypothetical protein